MSLESSSHRLLGHRPPLVVDTQGREHLITLAPTAVKPTGWIKEIAELELNGWLQMIIINDEHNLRNSFYDGTKTPFWGEWSGYWNDSFIGLSLLAGNDDQLNEMKEHIEAALAVADEKEKFLSPHYSGWGSHLQVHGLMTYYEVTGDERILNLCHRVGIELWENLNQPGFHLLDGDHPVNWVSSAVQIYGYTGDERLIDTAVRVMDRFDVFRLPNVQRLLNDDHLQGHGVNYCEDVRHPADVYIFTGNLDYLQASRRGMELTDKDHTQVQGVPSANEPVYGKGPMKETEHCNTVEWLFVGHSLLAATGESEYADLAEKALFNAWMGSRKYDAHSLSYNHSPNQITASSWDGVWVPRLGLSPYHQPYCCNLNSHRALHPYAFRMWMLTPDNTPAAVYYGDCTLDIELEGVGRVEIIEKSGYPYDENVSITLNPQSAAEFPISLRIPSWCTDARISVNGELLQDKPEAGAFHLVSRTWNPGDRIDLLLPMPITLQYCETFEEPAFNDPNHTDPNPEYTTQTGLRIIDNPQPGNHLVAVTRGPLVYTLYIKPKRIVEPDEHGYEDYINESVVPADDAGPWNVALAINRDNPEESFEFTKLDVPEGSAPTQYPPVGLKCKAHIIPDWKAAGTPDKPLTTLPSFPYKPSSETIDALLVPFGCTSIRLTWLPFTDISKTTLNIK